MSEPILWLIPGLPLLAAAVIGLLGPKYLRDKSHWPVLLGCFGACAVALWALSTLIGLPHEDVHRLSAPAATWFSAGNLHVSYSLAVDPLTAIMLTGITFIGSWIAVFSIGYMHGDPGYPRFFAEIALFVFSMCLLVMADNLLLLYAGWEGVRLCSYLLIGFWFEKPAAAAAARKAFLMTCIGDAGMILGIFLLWVSLGYKLDYASLFAAAPNADPTLLNTACLLLFCGAVGKSAQFPLHTWLPDAMEGPTPVSALIHAATMVTAGVYLVARCMPLFHLAPVAQATVAVIAIITALLAALIGLTQHDLKRVMAYSTVSQLGFMFLGLGSGRMGLAIVGVIAAIFHLFTHAFFKALLFLASGSVMHAMGNVIDMRRIGGLRRVLPITHATFLCGALALAAVPPFSGFWSKDEIVDTAWQASHLPNQHTFYLVLFLLAMFTAFLTAFYTFRAYFRTFWGEELIPPEAGSHGHGGHDAHSAAGYAAAHGHGHAGTDPVHGESPQPAPGHAHESPPVMTIPLIILAVGALFVGVAIGPTHWIGHFLAQTPAYQEYLDKLEPEPLNWGLMAGSAVIALAGVGLAYVVYVGNPGAEARFAVNFPRLYNLSQNRFYFDELYRGIVTLPAAALAKLSAFVDVLVDAIVDIVGLIPSLIGTWLRPIQNGLVQFYALAMVLGLTVFLVILTLRGG
jgi:proton-translocating NADH-quinone oxidoreductase chain L